MSVEALQWPLPHRVPGREAETAGFIFRPATATTPAPSMKLFFGGVRLGRRAEERPLNALSHSQLGVAVCKPVCSQTRPQERNGVA